MTYEEYKNNKNHKDTNKNSFFKNLLSKFITIVVFTFLVIIISKNNPKVKPLIKNQKKYLLLSVQLSLLSVAIFLIVFGAINGGSIDVLKKAIAICSECIGLG